MLNKNDYQNESKKLMLLCVAAASLVLLLFLVALYLHDNKDSTKHVVKEETQSEIEEKKIEVGKSNIISEDLDFWDMYDDEEKKPIEDIDEDETTKSDIEKARKLLSQQTTEIKSKTKSRDGEGEESSMGSKDVKKDENDDGKHVKVIGSDNKAVWYEILEDVKKNTYKFDEYLTYDNGFLKYNSSEAKSFVGMDLSSHQGSVDFNRVKSAGIDFAMLKVAGRGYESGLITVDEKFIEYANGATAVGMPIGFFVSSQAINEIEAVEEANFAVAASTNYNIKFPIAIELSSIKNDASRTSKLTTSERTAIVKKFCETVRGFGKTPAICASRDFFITELDLNELKDYDLWLKDEAVTADYMKSQSIEDADVTSEEDSVRMDPKNNKAGAAKKEAENEDEGEGQANPNRPDYIGTDFPYNFSMWQYTEKGTVNGLDGSVNLDLCFVNYAEK